MLHDVFISYTQSDRNVVPSIHDLFRVNQLKSWMALSGISLLLAIIRQRYYAGNGFILPAPGIEPLVDGVVLDKEAAPAPAMYIDESECSRFQQFLAF